MFEGHGLRRQHRVVPANRKVNARSLVGTQISNTAQAASTTPDPNNANDSATAIVTVVAAGSADLAVIEMDTPDPVAIGNNLNYTIVLTNNGPAGGESSVH
jgi:hypothetical protein